MFDSFQSHGLQYTRLLCPWDSPGKYTGVGCHFLLQEIFPFQGSNLSLLCLLPWQADSFTTEPLSDVTFLPSPGWKLYFACYPDWGHAVTCPLRLSIHLIIAPGASFPGKSAYPTFPHKLQPQEMWRRQWVGTDRLQCPGYAEDSNAISL